MYVMLTNAGRAALDANKGPVVVTEFILGDGYNYVPDPAQTAIKGTSLFSSVPSSAFAVTDDVWRYVCVIDSTVGEFQFGEVGLMLGDGTMFAIAVSSTLIDKKANSPVAIDAFVSMVGQNYDLWLDIGGNGNTFRIPTLVTVDQLPLVSSAIPNAYVVSGFQDDQQAFMAYTNKQGWWNFDAYDYLSASGTETQIVAVGTSSISIKNADYKPYMTPNQPGSVIVELVSGPIYSATRYIKEVVVGPSYTTFNFYSPWAVQPNVGDYIVFFVQRSTEVLVPTASTTQLGVIRVGNNLEIDAQGILSVDIASIPFPVTSFNGMQGNVTYQIKDQNPASGTSLVTDSGITSGTGQLRTIVAGQNISLALDSQSNLVVNNTYSYVQTHTPATATTLGEVIVGSGLSVDGTGTISLAQSPTTINGMSGNVVVKTVDQNPASGTTLITDDGSTTGIAKLRTIVAGSGISIDTDANNNLRIAGTYTLPKAGVWGEAGAVLGGVYVDGTTVTVDTNGMLVAHVDTGELARATTTTPGIVTIGPTLEVDANGVINYNLPIAGTGSTGVLGGVRIDGSSIQIDSNGVISSTSAIKSVNGLTGNVVISAVDNDSSTGTSWITDSGATTGNIKLRTLVAGQGMVVAPDSRGNLSVGLAPLGTITGVTGANLMWNENGEFGNTAAAYHWVDSNGKSISVLSNTSNGLFFRVAAQATPTTGTIKSPMYPAGSRLQHVAAMNLRSDSTATGNITFQVVYYLSDGTIATTGSVSSALALDANWHRLFNSPDSPDPSFTQFQVVISYANATWASLDWQRGKVEAGSVQTLYSEEGTVWQSLQLLNSSEYVLPVASASVLGGVKIGGGIAVTADGTISVTPYTLPVATSAVLGGVKIGNNVNVSGDGTISVTLPAPYVLTPATTTTLGGVIVGSGLSVDSTGLLSATGVVLGSTNPLMDGTVTPGLASTAARSDHVHPTDSSRAPIASPNFTGVPTVPTATAGTSTTQAASTAFVMAAVSSVSGVTSFNNRTGAITLSSSDISGASGALLSDVAAAKYYDVSGGAPGTLSGGQIVCQHSVVRNLSLAAGFPGSQAYAITAPAAQAVFVVNRLVSGTPTQIGTVTFAAGSNTGVFASTSGAAYTASPGNVIQIQAPATADSSMASVSITLLGLAS